MGFLILKGSNKDFLVLEKAFILDFSNTILTDKLLKALGTWNAFDINFIFELKTHFKLVFYFIANNMQSRSLALHAHSN